MKFTGLGDHFLRICKKKIVSSSFSLETKAPAIGLLFSVSVATNNPGFIVPYFGRFF